MLQVRTQASLPPWYIKLGQTHVIGGYLHASVDGQHLREIPVVDALEVVAVVT